MWEQLLPPTPTPIPTVSPAELGITFPEDAFNLWEWSPDIIQAWNTAGAAVTMFQAIILIGMIVGLAMIFYRRINAMVEDKR